MKVKLCFSMIMFSLALTIFGASKNVSAQAQGHVTQYLYKGYKVTYTINSEWEDCYIASLTIESTGEYAIDNYALSFFMNDMIEEKVTGYFKHRKKGNDKNERSCTCKSSGKLDQRSERFYLLQRQISPVFSAFSVCAGMGNHALGTYGQ